MTSLLPILSFLLVIIISLMVVRVATVALVLTGVSVQLARFQSRSAFTGVGFTTYESNKIMQHPVRRKIIMLLMLLGNAGLVTAVSTLMLSFVNTSDEQPAALWLRVGLLFGGIVLLWLVSLSPWVDRRVNEIVEWALRRWSDLDVCDYSNLLHLGHGYAVIEKEVREGSWMADRRLAELRLSEEGVLVLGVEHIGGEYEGGPRGATPISVGDIVIMYGPRDVLQNLDRRRAGAEGNWEHFRTVDQQLQQRREQQQLHEDEAASLPESRG